jgi:hypothetical protein
MQQLFIGGLQQLIPELPQQVSVELKQLKQISQKQFAVDSLVEQQILASHFCRTIPVHTKVNPIID